MLDITILARGQAALDRKRIEIQALMVIVKLFIKSHFADQDFNSQTTRIVMGEQRFSLAIRNGKLLLLRDVFGRPGTPDEENPLDAKSLRLEEIPVVHHRLFSATKDILVGDTEAFDTFCEIFRIEAEAAESKN